MRLFSKSNECQEALEALASYGLTEEEAKANEPADIPWHCVCCETPPNTTRYTSGMHPECREQYYPHSGRHGGTR